MASDRDLQDLERLEKTLQKRPAARGDANNIVRPIEGAKVAHNGSPDLDRAAAELARTDYGNAERFIRRFGAEFKFVQEQEKGRWIRWDGTRWNFDGAWEAVERAAQDTVRAIQDEACAIRGTDADREIPTKGDRKIKLSDALTAWGVASESAQKIKAIPQLAQSRLACSQTAFDADPWVLNVRNGTIRIVRGTGEDPVRFGPHDPADMCTKIAGVEFDPEATCPRFDQFFARVQPEDEMRRLIFQFTGLSLTGYTGEQLLAIYKGKGGNGKSVYMDTVAHVAGEYARTIPVSSFIDQGRGQSAGGATPDMAMLPGVRLLRTSEPERGAKLAEGRLKEVTGGEPMLVRHLHRGYFEFTPCFKLTISCNYRPEISGVDDGIWRRVLLIPWPVTIPESERDRNLIDVLRTEGSGVLNRLLDGLRDWCDHGLIIPEKARKATESYREDSDPLGRFLRMAVKDVDGEEVQSSVLYRVFVAWARKEGERVWSQRGFTFAMRDRGYKSKRSDVVKWQDIELTDDGVRLETEPSPPPSEGAADA